MIALLVAGLFVGAPVSLGSPVGDYTSGGADGVSSTGIVATGTPTSPCTTVDGVLHTNIGSVGCPKQSDTAPNAMLLRAQPAYAQGTQTAAPLTLAGGADETKTTIGTFGNCGTDTVTVSVTTRAGTTTTSVLTEGTNWTASVSNASTATSLAAAVDALAGVVSTAVSATVYLTYDDTTAAIQIATSDATCDTVSNGTGGGVRFYTPGLNSNGQGAEIISTATGNVLRNLYATNQSMCLGRDPASSSTASSFCSVNGGLQINDSSGGFANITPLSVPISLNSQNAATSVTDTIRLNAGNVFTATSGTQTNVNILATYNQASGTAGIDMLAINATTTAVGSGVQNFIIAKDDTVQKFAVNFAGTATSASNALTAGTMTANSTGQLLCSVSSYSWTNAMVAALSGTAGDILVATLPAKTSVTNAYVVITGSAAGPATVTVAVGRVSAAYIDYVVASDAKAAPNVIYGDGSAERGTGIPYDLPSYTTTTAVNAHFISTVANLSTTTGSTGTVYLTTCALP